MKLWDYVSDHQSVFAERSSACSLLEEHFSGFGGERRAGCFLFFFLVWPIPAAWQASRQTTAPRRSHSTTPVGLVPCTSTLCGIHFQKITNICCYLTPALLDVCNDCRCLNRRLCSSPPCCSIAVTTETVPSTGRGAPGLLLYRWAGQRPGFPPSPAPAPAPPPAAARAPALPAPRPGGAVAGQQCSTWAGRVSRSGGGGWPGDL